jgi:hypothetical protein
MGRLNLLPCTLFSRIYNSTYSRPNDPRDTSRQSRRKQLRSQQRPPAAPNAHNSQLPQHAASQPPGPHLGAAADAARVLVAEVDRAPRGHRAWAHGDGVAQRDVHGLRGRSSGGGGVVVAVAAAAAAAVAVWWWWWWQCRSGPIVTSRRSHASSAALHPPLRML